MQTLYKYSAVVLLAALSAVAVFKASNSQLSAQQVVQNTTPASSGSIRGSGVIAGASTNTAVVTTIKPAPKLSMPISRGLTRVTKKPYGLYVTPENSPVSDDIFIGYHTGIDFEIFADEQYTDVSVTAACDGTALLKEWANGYGGVFVQSCNIDGQDVTVIYGHLKLESITVVPGQTLLAGDKIGILGQGFTDETYGRRKHLHFDIHKGTEINVLGYVPNQEDLAGWIDPITYLQ